MKFVVLQGEPERWAEDKPVFFESIKKAEDYIRKNSKEWLDDDGALPLGAHEDWCEPYFILEVKKSFQPVIKISAAVSLKQKKLDIQE